MPPSLPTSVYVALRANDQVRRFKNSHSHYNLLMLSIIGGDSGVSSGCDFEDMTMADVISATLVVLACHTG